MGDKNNPYYNTSGCPDPTAHAAVKAVMRDEAELDEHVSILIKVLKFIINNSGFELVNRIELRDRKTGRYFR